MSESRDQVIGELLADVVRDRLRAQAAFARPMVLVRLFGTSEIQSMVTALRDDAGIEVVVASRRAESSFSHEVLLPAGRSLTWYRNRPGRPVVLVEIDGVDDHQGLTQLFTLNDRTLLPREDAPTLRRNFELLVGHAWRAGASKNIVRDPPGPLVEALADVHAVVTTRAGIRVFVEYVLAVCGELDRTKALASEELRRVAGLRLDRLSLVPDPELFAHGRLQARLDANRHVAELRAPNGREIDEDLLLERIQRAEFLSAGGEALPQREQGVIRVALAAVVNRPGPETLSATRYTDWLRVHEGARARRGLGSRVRDDLDKHAPGAAASEFGDLGIEEGLDQNDQEAARAVLETEVEGVPLVEYLSTPGLRRRVQKVALPRVETEGDPLRALIHQTYDMDEPSEGAPAVLHFGIEGGEPRNAARSRWLFAFLYGPTLAEVAELSADGLSGWRLDVDSRLLVPGTPPGVDEDDPEATEREWEPLRLVLRVEGEEQPQYTFSWKRDDLDGLAALAWLVSNADAPDFPLQVRDFEEWCRTCRELGIETPARAGDDAWRRVRQQHLDNLSRHGISVDRLQTYFSEWLEAASRARADLVPTSGPLGALDCFLDVDLLHERPSQDARIARIVMLASHPLRLRWFARHLERTRGYLVDALAGELELNDWNDGLFFDWLDRASPHRQPPAVAPGSASDAVATAVREFGLHEEYVPIRSEGGEQAGSTDDQSIRAVTDVVSSYLKAFPHKRDGLSVLLRSADGEPHLPLRLARQIRRTEGAVLELHVVADRKTHSRLASELGALDESERPGPGLLPAFQLVLHDTSAFERSLAHLEAAFDIAVIPDLLGSHTNVLHQTRASGDGISGATFDPWLDPPFQRELGGDGSAENFSHILLPGTPDRALETWSTLTVRRARSAAVSPDTPANVDFVSIQIRFDNRQELFLRLHSLARWVVTLDPYLSREQIDALDSRPDIIMLRTGIGKNESYTLVVSSTAGEEFVVDRLARKLKAGLGLPLDESTERVAERLYVVARGVAPGLMLRALGLGRTAEEILGLVASRAVLAERPRVPTPERGLVWWISLDEHLNWFGPRARADLLRVVVDLSGQRARMWLTVVESKYRRAGETGAGEYQVRVTAELFSQAFSGDSQRRDSDVWRRELARVLEEAPAGESGPLPAARWLGGSAASIRRDVHEHLRQGSYELMGVEPVVCVLDAHREGSEATVDPDLDGVRRIVLPRGALARILRELTGPGVAEVVPDATAGTTSEVGDDREHGGGRRQVGRMDDNLPNDDGPSGGVYPPENHDPDDPQSGERTSPTAVTHSAKLSPAELEGRLQTVLDTLSSHGVHVEPPDDGRHAEGPGFYLLRVVPRPGVTVDKVAARADDLKLALGLEREQAIRCYVDRKAVVLEVPKRDDERYLVDARMLWDRVPVTHDGLLAPIGEDLSGEIVSIDFSSSNSPHLLIAGATGSGKSVALETILAGLCERYPPTLLRLRLVDPKETELLEFEGSEHLDGSIGSDADDAEVLLEDAVNEMQSRYKAFRAKRVKSLPEFNRMVGPGERKPWLVLVLDEYADLTSDPDDRKRIEPQIKRLSQKARAAGIHLIVATQRPSAEILSTTVRGNLPAQLALRVKSAIDSRIIIDESGAEALAGRGDALLRTAEGTRRIQCGMV